MRETRRNTKEVMILWMEEILHQLIDSLSHYLLGFNHPRWCRISSIHSTTQLTQPTTSCKIDIQHHPCWCDKHQLPRIFQRVAASTPGKAAALVACAFGLSCSETLERPCQPPRKYTTKSEMVDS